MGGGQQDMRGDMEGMIEVQGGAAGGAMGAVLTPPPPTALQEDGGWGCCVIGLRQGWGVASRI